MGALLRGLETPIHEICGLGYTVLTILAVLKFIAFVGFAKTSIILRFDLPKANIWRNAFSTYPSTDIVRWLTHNPGPLALYANVSHCWATFVGDFFSSLDPLSEALNTVIPESADGGYPESRRKRHLLDTGSRQPLVRYDDFRYSRSDSSAMQVHPASNCLRLTAYRLPLRSSLLEQNTCQKIVEVMSIT